MNLFNIYIISIFAYIYVKDIRYGFIAPAFLNADTIL